MIYDEDGEVLPDITRRSETEATIGQNTLLNFAPTGWCPDKSWAVMTHDLMTNNALSRQVCTTPRWSGTRAAWASSCTLTAGPRTMCWSARRSSAGGGQIWWWGQLLTLWPQDDASRSLQCRQWLWWRGRSSAGDTTQFLRGDIKVCSVFLFYYLHFIHSIENVSFPGRRAT